MNKCKYREKIKNKDMHVCTAFIDWWEKDTPKDRVFLTEPDCMCELYETLKEYLGHQQIIDDLRSKGHKFCDMDLIPYIESLEKRYTKNKGNKYDYIMNKCLYLKNREWLKEEWYK